MSSSYLKKKYFVYLNIYIRFHEQEGFQIKIKKKQKTIMLLKKGDS